MAHWHVVPGRRKAPDLFKEIKSAKSHKQRIHLSQSLAQRIDDFLVAQESEPKPDKAQTEYVERWVAAKKTAAEPKSEPERFRESTRELIEREGLRIRTERAVVARFEFWQTQGLLNTQKNADEITNFISILRVPLTPNAVDTAVVKLRDRLEWYKPAPPQPAWKPGDPLPPDATVQMLRDSSVDEIKAWRRRKQ